MKNNLELSSRFSLLPGYTHMPPKILHDNQVPGGDWRRDWDRHLSEALGGYRSARTGELSAYGKYVEPLLHATEHTGRAVWDFNAAEWGRAKDEVRTFGDGLRHNDHTYQRQYETAAAAGAAPKKEGSFTAQDVRETVTKFGDAMSKAGYTGSILHAVHNGGALENFKRLGPLLSGINPEVMHKIGRFAEIASKLGMVVSAALGAELMVRGEYVEAAKVFGGLAIGVAVGAAATAVGATGAAAVIGGIAVTYGATKLFECGVDKIVDWWKGLDAKDKQFIQGQWEASATTNEKAVPLTHEQQEKMRGLEQLLASSAQPTSVWLDPQVEAARACAEMFPVPLSQEAVDTLRKNCNTYENLAQASGPGELKMLSSALETSTMSIVTPLCSIDTAWTSEKVFRLEQHALEQQQQQEQKLQVQLQQQEQQKLQQQHHQQQHNERTRHAPTFAH